MADLRAQAYLAESFSQAVMTYRKAHNLVPSTKRLYQLVDILRVLNLVCMMPLLSIAVADSP